MSVIGLEYPAIIAIEHSIVFRLGGIQVGHIAILENRIAALGEKCAEQRFHGKTDATAQLDDALTFLILDFRHFATDRMADNIDKQLGISRHSKAAGSFRFTAM